MLTNLQSTPMIVYVVAVRTLVQCQPLQLIPTPIALEAAKAPSESRDMSMRSTFDISSFTMLRSAINGKERMFVYNEGPHTGLLKFSFDVNALP